MAMVFPQVKEKQNKTRKPKSWALLRRVLGLHLQEIKNSEGEMVLAEVGVVVHDVKALLVHIRPQPVPLPFYLYLSS